MKKVYLNDNLEEIGDFAFSGTIKNTYLTMPKNLKTIGNNAFSGWIIDNLTLNEKLETIGDGAFSGVKGTINIPNSVKSIGYIAFAGTFNKVIIGTGLEHLKKDAFTSSASTGSFYVNLGVPLEMDGYIFCGNMVDYDIQNKWTLYVPKGSKNAYKEKIYWNKFKSIIEDNTLISGNGTPSDDNDNGNDENGNQVDKDILGYWTVLMDDPSWKVIIQLKANGVCEGTDWYDIEGDNTFSEKDSTWKGTYSLNANKITISSESVIAGSYTFTSVSSNYFEAADKDGWKIYATKK